MPSTKLETLRIPDWVPDAARRALAELWTHPWLDDAERKLLDRLATYDAMKTGVWEKLPSEPKDFEGDIIHWAWGAFVIFRRRRRPFPKTKSKAKWEDWAKHLRRDFLPDFAHTSSLARIVRDQMIGHHGDAQPYWQHFWEGDKNLTLDQVIVVIDQVSAFYRKVDENYWLFLRSLPEVKRWGGKKPSQKFFTEVLSKRMTATYGKPLDSIVATLAEVGFDLAEGVGAETIRGRRRTPGTPENSRRKSR
jgi:hypothetical protein